MSNAHSTSVIATTKQNQDISYKKKQWRPPSKKKKAGKQNKTKVCSMSLTFVSFLTRKRSGGINRNI
jgi:hypothetical protein